MVYKTSPLTKISVVMFFMSKVKKDFVIFSIGGISYGAIEILWRKYTHWTMLIAGGVCFLILFKIFDKFNQLTMIKKCLTGTGVITAVEFLCGCIVNIGFKMNVWDYSNLPFNIMGQICPIYSLIWAGLTVPISFICSFLRKRMA